MRLLPEGRRVKTRRTSLPLPAAHRLLVHSLSPRVLSKGHGPMGAKGEGTTLKRRKYSKKTSSSSLSSRLTSGMMTGCCPKLTYPERGSSAWHTQAMRHTYGPHLPLAVLRSVVDLLCRKIRCEPTCPPAMSGFAFRPWAPTARCMRRSSFSSLRTTSALLFRRGT